MADTEFDIVAVVRPGVLPIDTVTFRSSTSGFSMAMTPAGVLDNGDEVYKTTFTFPRGAFRFFTLSTAWGDEEGQFNVQVFDGAQQRSHRFPDLTMGNHPEQDAATQTESAVTYNGTRRTGPQVIMAGFSPSVLDIVDTQFDVVAVVREGVLPLDQVTLTQNEGYFSMAMQEAGELDNGDKVYKMTYTLYHSQFWPGMSLTQLWGDQPGQFNIQAVDSGQQRTHAFPDIEFGNYPPLEVHNQAPTANFVATPTSGGAPLTVTLVASASDADGTIESYEWVSSDGQTASGATATMTFDEVGGHTITLTVTDDDGATTQTSQAVTVTEATNAAPVASFTLTRSGSAAPFNVALVASGSSDTDGTITSYEWSASDGQTATGVTAGFLFTMAGTYTITLTVTDDEGATAQMTQTVTVDAPVGSLETTTNSLWMTFVTVPEGSFMMGDTETQYHQPVHEVSVRSFRMMTTEVTQAQWEAVMGTNPSNYPRCGPHCPVEQVSWNDVQAFIAQLNTQTGENYRLPTEAEWEYAARAGTTTNYWWGDEPGSGNVNCWEGECDELGYMPMAVGSFAPNLWGLYNTAGNVSEWVQDCWHRSYVGGPVDGSSWESDGCDGRVFRGGSFVHNYPDDWFYSSKRATRAPDYRGSHLGFRLAQDL